MKIILIGLLCLITVSDVTLSARILAYFPMPAYSHQVVFRGLIDELAKRGHHIVIITPDPLGPNALPHYENVTEIDIHNISYMQKGESLNSSNLQAYDRDYDSLLLERHQRAPAIIEAQLSSEPVKDFIKNTNQKFDLFFGESLFPITFAFGAYFKAPYIGVCSSSGRIFNFEAMGSPTHPLLYPDVYRRFSGKLDFWKKIATIKTDLVQRYAQYLVRPVYDDLVKKHFGDGIPSIVELHNNMEMLFINHHPILAGVRPVVPGIVYMSNMHFKPIKPLPQDLKKLLDEATEGVIYFSLGSSVLSKHLSLPKINVILEAFSELKYTILWKFENDTLEGQPDNVHISKWFPQMDLLGHTNVKVFITQGGQHSMEEGLYNKVPFIGIPFNGDQYFITERMQELGIGIRLNIETLTKDELKEAIVKVAEGKSYLENISKFPALLEDQPMTGKERAVWWTEYVLRHGGARHLRAPAADVTWIEYFMLDVIVPLLLVVITFIVALCIAVKKIMNSIKFLVCSKKLKTN